MVGEKSKFGGSESLGRTEDLNLGGGRGPPYANPEKRRLIILSYLTVPHRAWTESREFPKLDSLSETTSAKDGVHRSIRRGTGVTPADTYD